MLRYKTGMFPVTAIVQYSTGGSGQSNKIRDRNEIGIHIIIVMEEMKQSILYNMIIFQ